jgi:hypothetical protein
LLSRLQLYCCRQGLGFWILMIWPFYQHHLVFRRVIVQWLERVTSPRNSNIGCNHDL